MKWFRLFVSPVLVALGMAASASAQSADIDRYSEGLFARSGLPGLAVAVVEGDRVVYVHGFGDDGNGGAVTADTPFILGSTSKSFTALAILQLAESGRLKLDSPVSAYLPQFMNGAKAITVRMLLNQTSGISGEAGDQPVVDAGESGPNAIRHWASGLRENALDRAPGQSYEYSNANFVVLGAIVEAASGEAYAQYLETHIFAPLGMTHSRATLPGPLARGHKQVFGRNYVSDLPYPESFVPCGFIISTSGDIAKYLSAQLPGSAQARALGISDEGIALWHKGVAPMDAEGKAHYAMGWATDTFNSVPVIWHSGDTGVFSSEFTLEPKGKWGVVVLSDGSGWLASRYLQEISSGIVSKLVGRAPRDDTSIHRIILAIYLAVLAVPLLQLLALWAMRNRKRGWFRQTWPVLLHGVVAGLMLLALPRMLFGIPLSELVTSFPDMGGAAVLSGVAAVLAAAMAANKLVR